MWNPEKAKKTQFTTDREESCTANLTLRVPPSKKEKLKHIKGWHDKVRNFLDEIIDMEESKSA